MTANFHVPFGPGAYALAALAVVLGGPWFGQGLRALRLRRLFADLTERPLDDTATGLVQTRGRVMLESPLFAPLSALRCAGYQLDVRATRGRVGGTIRMRRPFQLVTEGTTARVLGEHGTWDMPVTAERVVAPGEALSENVAALLGSSPELRWLRDLRVPLRLTERALEAGTVACVVGVARHARPAEMTRVMPLARTGTDDVAISHTFTTPAGPDLWIEPGEPLDVLHVTTTTPTAESLHVPGWHLVGLVAGPVLTVIGLLVLVRAAEQTFGGKF